MVKKIQLDKMITNDEDLFNNKLSSTKMFIIITIFIILLIFLLSLSLELKEERISYVMNAILIIILIFFLLYYFSYI